MSSKDVSSACSALALAAELVTDPKTSREDRLRAYQECESFKDTSPIAPECGFVLASDVSKSLVVRICGLKVLEDSIKSRWNDFHPSVKLSLKENLMNMIRSSMGDVLTEPIHIKDGISRCVVEIIKREWPQQWPTLLTELNGCCVSEIGTEISLFIILRLVEDVAVLQNLEQTQRRKEIYTALTQQLEDIFAFLMSLLERHYKAYLESTEIMAKKRQVKVCSAALGTFNAFVEWVSLSYIMANDKYLIRCLCHLLMDESLQLNAGECLLNIVSAKCSKNQDRLQFLSFFETDMITLLFSATEAAEQKSSSDEAHYVFLKKMVLILVELGNQLCGLWTIKEKQTQRPNNFDVYLNAILFFTRHPSLTVNFYVNELWIKFFKLPEISQDDMFKDFVPKWVEIALKKTIKLGYRNEGFSMLDFETEEEYGTFFGKYRIIILEGVKLVCCNYSPKIIYDYVEEWLSSLLSNPMNESAYSHVEAISLILDPVLSKSDITSILPRALHLLKSILDYETSDPILSSNLLSCISASFILVSKDSTLLPVIMNKIFSSITFTEGDTSQGQQMSQAVKTLRRHGCSLLVKIATRYASTLHPIFDHLKDTIASLRETEKISKMEFSCLVEALVLVSNEFKNYSIQTSFVENVSAFPFEEFKSIHEILSSADTFVDFIGITKVNDEKVDKLIQDPYYANRSKISFCTTFLLSVCRRTKVPSDVNDYRSGGFILHEEPHAGGSLVSLRNPAASVANAVLPLFLSLARVINSLWAPENLNRYGYAHTLEVIDTEKLSITGTASIDNSSSGIKDKKKSSREKMKSFIYETYENIFHFLYECCSGFGSEFYRLPGLADAIKSYLFVGIQNVPDYRLRCLVKTFMKSFIHKCPKNSYSDVLWPVLLDFCPFMLTRLTERWKYIESIIVSDDDAVDGDDKDSKEVLEDVFLRHLTRDYLNAIKSLFIHGGGSDIVINSNNINEPEVPKDLSHIGTLVLEDDSLRECILVTLLRALVWTDSNASVRACNLLELILPHVVQLKKFGEDAARQIMFSILSGFHAQGQHELNNIALTQLAIQSYEWMRPRFPVVLDVLSQVPGCNQEDLKRFDDRIMVAINGRELGKGGDRVKKDMFKRIISQFVGKDKALLFKKEVIIKNLPSLIPAKTRHKNLSLDETENKCISLTTLFDNGTK